MWAAMSRIKEESPSGSVTATYQGVDLKRYKETGTFLKSHHREYINAVQECLRERVKVQSTDLLTHALTILATHRWQRSEDTSFRHEALESVCTRFPVPLENTKVDCSFVKEEWDDVGDYANWYLKLVQEDCNMVETFSCEEVDQYPLGCGAALLFPHV